MSRAAKLLGVSTLSEMHWIEQFAHEHAPEPRGRALVIELDEMWTIQRRTNKLWGWKAWDVLQADWLTGNSAVVTGPPWSGCSPA